MVHQKRTLLVTGGAGSVGSALVEYVYREKLADWDLRVFELNTAANERYLRQFKKRATIIYGDLRNAEQVSDAVRGVDAIIHLGAVIPPLADEHPALAEAVNVGGTRNIIEAMKAHTPDAFLLYASSISVYGDRLKSPYISVTDPLTPSLGDEYALTKMACEKMLQESGLQNWTIFRLAAMMNTRMVQYFVPTMFHMPIETPVEICWTIDSAVAFFNAIDCQPLRRRIFNLGGGPKMRLYYRDILVNFLKVAGIRGALLPENAFATCNFHCGFYADSQELEDLLHFQKHNLEEFLAAASNAHPWRRKLLEWISPFILPIVRFFLLRMSEPLIARKQKDKKLCYRFFGTESPVESQEVAYIVS